MRELQQLPQLRRLVVVEHGLLGGGEDSEVSWTLRPEEEEDLGPLVLFQLKEPGQVSAHVLIKKVPGVLG